MDQTINFINSNFIFKNSHESIDNILPNLISAIKSDGYQIESNTIQDQIRRLSECEESRPEGFEFFVYFMMVCICVICAGFASGLTQVCLI